MLLPASHSLSLAPSPIPNFFTFPSLQPFEMPIPKKPPVQMGAPNTTRKKFNAPNIFATPPELKALNATKATKKKPIAANIYATPRSSVPSSPASQQSAPMDESDSESDSPQRTRGSGDEANQYPIDGLFRDYEEKEHIMGLREIEREQILAERREENERLRQNRMLRQLKVNQDKDIKKRKASAADLEDNERKTARVRTKVGETSEKMDSLRRAREERSNRKEQRERENRGRKQQSPSYRRSPGEADEDSEREWLGPNKSKPKSRSPDLREGPPAELRDIERLRVGRSRFSEFCFYPNFDKTMTGCYVRINIGPDPETGNDVYRMAVIKGKYFSISGMRLVHKLTKFQVSHRVVRMRFLTQAVAMVAATWLWTATSRRLTAMRRESGRSSPALIALSLRLVSFKLPSRGRPI